LRGVQGSIIVSCSGAALAATAAEALPSPPKVADNEPIRLRRPTAEPGASETEVGLLGWLAQQQGRLHQAVTEALAGLHRDNNAFWALGSFTFLYGVFSAASGSGDRQAAISSSGHRGRDRQHTRVPASSRSSILQSGLAIGLAVVAALLLQLSLGTAGIPAQWTTIGSYALVAFLGAWLVARKFYGTRRVAGLARVRAVLFEGAPVRSTYARSAASEQRRAEMNEAPGRTPLLTLDGLGPGLGAFVVMTFAVSQNLLPAGLVAVILLAVGASLPAALPGSAGSRSLPDAHPSTSAPVFSLKQAVRWAELLVSSLILCFGLVLLVAGP
jgi:nickel/cobalt transporter (NicO) family protein